MSRAFVKETENDTVELPDRPISPHRNLVTETGLAAIKATLSRFEAAHRAATENGDREAVAAASREIRYWGARLASAEVVNLPADKSKASFGMTVTLRRDDGREQSFKIVGEDEADPSCGTVSHASPLARAVLSHGPGEAVMIAGREALTGRAVVYDRLWQVSPDTLPVLRLVMAVPRPSGGRRGAMRNSGATLFMRPRRSGHRRRRPMQCEISPDRTAALRNVHGRAILSSPDDPREPTARARGVMTLRNSGPPGTVGTMVPRGGGGLARGRLVGLAHGQQSWPQAAPLPPGPWSQRSRWSHEPPAGRLAIGDRRCRSRRASIRCRRLRYWHR